MEFAQIRSRRGHKAAEHAAIPRRSAKAGPLAQMPKTVPIFLFKLAVTAGLIYWFVLPGIDLETVRDRIGRLSPLFLLAAGALIFFQNALVVTWRWERVVAAIDTPLPAWRLLKATVIALFFNQVLPSTIGGDGMRVWFLRNLGRSTGLAFRSVLIDRLIGFFGLLLLCLLGSLYLMARLEATGPLWVMTLVSLAGLVLIALSPVLVNLVAWIPLERVRRLFETLAREVNDLARNRPRLARLVGASIAGQLALGGAVFCLARDLDVPLGLLGACAVVPGVMVAASLPISIAGWGVREATMVVGLGLLGVGQSEAAIISVGFGLLSLLLGFVGGLVWLLSGGPQPKAKDLEALDVAVEGRSNE